MSSLPRRGRAGGKSSGKTTIADRFTAAVDSIKNHRLAIPGCASPGKEYSQVLRREVLTSAWRHRTLAGTLWDKLAPPISGSLQTSEAPPAAGRAALNSPSDRPK